MTDPRFERQHPLAVCEQCEGDGYVLGRASVHSKTRLARVNCPACEGTGQPKLDEEQER